MKNKENAVLIVGIIAMLGLVAATLMPGGSLLQKVLFVIGVPTLAGVAYFNKQKMYIVLQSVATISAVLAFWSLPQIFKYVIFIGAATIGIVYLIKIGYSKEDKYWSIGALGLLCIAVGLATDAATQPLIFNALLGLGGFFISVYSAIGLFCLKIRIAALWLILNICFSIGPLMFVFSKLF
jgi:hypothetical protein